MYDMAPRSDEKIALGDFNAKIGKKLGFRLTIEANSKHEESSNNGFRVVEKEW